jgi:hypothetical protein
MGPTGVGKSSVSMDCGIKDDILTYEQFINTAVNKEVLEVETSYSLSPCTKEFAHVRCTFENSRRVVFVDTPPISNSYHSSSEKKVGEKINEWLEQT